MEREWGRGNGERKGGYAPYPPAATGSFGGLEKPIPNAWGLFAAACAATMSADLLRSVAEERFVRRAGLSRCDARLPQALLLPPPSRQHNGLEGMQDSPQRKQ